jgi:hypothetical protein
VDVGWECTLQHTNSNNNQTHPNRRPGGIYLTHALSNTNTTNHSKTGHVDRLFTIQRTNIHHHPPHYPKPSNKHTHNNKKQGMYTAPFLSVQPVRFGNYL